MICGLVRCAPLIAPPNTRSVHVRETEACTFDGNPDFYGLGIRVGIHLQWITAILATLSLAESIPGNLETNGTFLLALFIATAVAAAQITVQTAEIIVLLQLSFGFLFSVLFIWGLWARPPAGASPIRFALLGSLFRVTLATALSAYSA